MEKQTTNRNKTIKKTRRRKKKFLDGIGVVNWTAD